MSDDHSAVAGAGDGDRHAAAHRADGAGAERVDVILEARAENASGWWDRPLPGVPTEMGTLASYAVDANSLTDWSVSLVPGLLQVEE